MNPLIDMDKEEKKFEIFLSMHKSSLHVSDLKVFLPFTINLDPFIRKVRFCSGVCRDRLSRSIDHKLLILTLYV